MQKMNQNIMKEEEMLKLVFYIGRLEERVYYPLGTYTLDIQNNTLDTAAHVIDRADENLVIRLNDNFNGGYQDTTEPGLTLVKVEIVKIDPIKDVCILRLVGSNDVKSNLRIGNTDNINVGDRVAIVGFPHSD